MTSKISKILTGHCLICNRKQSLTVSDNTIPTKSLGDFFRNLGKKGLSVSKRMAKNIIRNPGRAFEIGANVGTAFASRSPKMTLSSPPEQMNFYHTGRRLYLGKIVWFML